MIKARRFSVSQRLGAAAANAALADIRAVSAKKHLRILEIALSLTAATATTVGLVRTATMGTASTSVAGQPYDSRVAAAEGLLGSAWSAAPTLPGTPVYLRRVVMPATIGAQVVWKFENEPLIVKPSTSLALWNLGGAAAGVLDAYVVFDEVSP